MLRYTSVQLRLILETSMNFEMIDPDSATIDALLRFRTVFVSTLTYFFCFVSSFK